ncbi:MAG: DUF4383 domain-containing protein [Mycobacterium sp.]
MAVSRSRVRRRPQEGLLAVQCAAILVGSLLLIVGTLGFIPGITTGLDSLQLSGPRSEAAVFGVFEISVLHNLLNVAVGVAGLVLASSYARARAYLLLGGALYLGLWVFGLVIDHESPANVLPVNNADNWLHLGLGVAMVVLGLTLAGARLPRGARGEILVPPGES